MQKQIDNIRREMVILQRTSKRYGGNKNICNEKKKYL